MTHDPLCPSLTVPKRISEDIYYDRYRCECDLIIKVRADERLNALVVIGESHSLQDAAVATLVAEPPYLGESGTAP